MAKVSGRVWMVGLLVLGLVVSLLGVSPPGAVGTHGEEEDIDFAPMYSACVGRATDSAGFEDTAGIGAEEAIDCLFHYGITKGRSETMYAPSESVLRWQMALFLARASMAAGIVLDNPAEDQGFTDISAVSEEAQNAINGLAKEGIMPGTSATTFSPNSSVNRGSMAMLLDAFLSKATPGTGAFGEATEKYADVKADNFNVFTDVNTVSLNTYNAIYRIYELGVTKGVAEHQFNPAGLVTRGQMASFITRAFAHTIARPAGVSIQSEQDMVLGAQGVPLIVSVRDVNFQPVQDASVDVFRSADADEAFGDDGACVTANVNRVGQVGQTACEVDLGDSTTDASGDLTDLSLQITDADATVWAWTGDRGDKFDSDDTTRAQLTVGFSKAATQTLVTDNLEEGQTRSKFGETVTVTIQIADPDDKAVADKGKRVTVAQSTTVGDNTTSSTNSMTTDADGKIVLEFTQTDPSTNTGDSATVTLTLTNPPAGLPFKNEDGSDFSSDTYSWSDEAPRPATLTVTSRNEFVLASDEGQGAGNTVTATLTDQFGDPVRGKRITFTSDTLCVKKQPTDAECVTHGVGANNYMRTTGRDGRANLGYNYDNTNSVIEAIRATYTYVGTEGVRGVVDTTDPLPMGDPKDETVLTSEPVHHYWVEEPTGDPFTGRILVKDPDNDQVVVAAEEKLMLVKYDGNDQFNLESGTTIFSEFEKLLEENADPAGAHLKVTSYEDAAADVSVFTVQEEWPGLDHPAGANGRFNYPIVVADNGIIVVGHYLETVTSGGTQMPHAGAVYIYPNGMDTAANNIVKLTAPTPFACGYFGYDVDITDNTVVVGNAFVGIDSGRLRPVVGLGEGQTCAMSSSYEKKVYVYTRTDSGWPIDATFTSVDAQNNTGFGEGVAISSDGSTIAVVGPGSNNNGAVFVFEKPQTGGWVDNTTAGQGRLRGGGGDGVGWIRTERSVAISGDGSVIAAGGCNNEGSTGTCGGWLYVYEKDPTASWDGVTKADGDARFLAYEGTGDPNVATDYGQGRQSRHEFAKYVALSDDGTVLVASGHYRAEAEKPGEVYVWNKPETGGWRVHHIDRRLPGMTPNVGFKLKVSSPRNSDVFGQYIAVTGDGSEIAASRHYRQEGTFRGSVVTFKRPADGAWANDSTPDDEYLGPYVRAHLGWQTTYDKSNSDLYTAVSAANDMESPLSIFKITR